MLRRDEIRSELSTFLSVPRFKVRDGLCIFVTLGDALLTEQRGRLRVGIKADLNAVF